MTNGTRIPDLERHLSAHPSSPLFARLAETLLRTGEITRAERLCEQGLASHPGYATGRLIHARCLAARGEYDRALGVLESVSARYPGNILLAELSDEWRSRVTGGSAGPPGGAFTETGPGEVVETLPLPDDVRLPDVFPSLDIAPGGSVSPAGEDLPPAFARPPEGAAPVTGIIPPEAPLPAAAEQAASEAAVPAAPPRTVPSSAGTGFPDEPPPPAAVAPSAEASPAGTGGKEIGVIGAEDSGGVPGFTVAPADADLRGSPGTGVAPPMPVPGRHTGTVPLLQPVPQFRKGRGFVEGGRIVSRTLAEIYASQGAIGEAVVTYRILLERMPERREELEPRLRELEERLRSDQGGRPQQGNAKAPA